MKRQAAARRTSKPGAGGYYGADRAHMARIRPKAEAVRRVRYAQRLRHRLAGLTTPAAIWRAAYLAGYRTAYARYLRQLRRGELLLVTPRPVRIKWEAA